MKVLLVDGLIHWILVVVVYVQGLAEDVLRLAEVQEQREKATRGQVLMAPQVQVSGLDSVDWVVALQWEESPERDGQVEAGLV